MPRSTPAQVKAAGNDRKAMPKEERSRGIEGEGSCLEPLSPKSSASGYRAISSSTEQAATDEGAWHGPPSSSALHDPFSSHGLFMPPDTTSRLSQESPRSIADVTCIKQEPSSPPRHAYDNAAPILAGAQGEDVLLASLQCRKGSQYKDLEPLIRKQAIRAWGSVTEAIEQSLSSSTSPDRQAKTIKAIKQRITERAQDFLLLTPAERATYLDRAMRVVDVPGLGRGVEANRPIDAFEVLGAYAGRLASSKELADEKREKGALKVDTYLCRTAWEGRFVSGFQYGNVLSLINEDDKPERNNVGFIRLGGDVTFYVALRPIAQSEPMLADYGPCYDRSGWSSHPIELPSDEEASCDSANADEGPTESACSSLLSDTGHPAYPMFLEVGRQIGALGRFDWSPDQCANLAASTVVSARGGGLERVDAVVLDNEARVLTAVCKRHPDAGDNFFNATVEVEVEAARMKPLAESSAQWQQGERSSPEQHDPRESQGMRSAANEADLLMPSMMAR